MPSRPARQVAAIVSFVATVAAVALNAPAAQARTAITSQAPAADQALPHARTAAAAAPDDQLLDEPGHGRAAIEALGTDLAEAAVLNDLEPVELRELLLKDRTAWVDQQGAIL